MFDHVESVIGLLPGERPQDLQAEEDLAFLMTQMELADGWVDDDRQFYRPISTT